MTRTNTTIRIIQVAIAATFTRTSSSLTGICARAIGAMIFQDIEGDFSLKPMTMLLEWSKRNTIANCGDCRLPNLSFCPTKRAWRRNRGFLVETWLCGRHPWKQFLCALIPIPGIKRSQHQFQQVRATNVTSVD
jgi:hypothetical protein